MTFANDLSIDFKYPDHRNLIATVTGQKIRFSIKDFFSKCDQIRIFRSLMENFIFCAVCFSNFNCPHFI